MALILNNRAEENEEIATRPLANMDESFTNKYSRDFAEQRHEEMGHSTYMEERVILDLVRKGQIDQLEATYRAMPEIRYGHMSSNPLRQLFYGCIANTTLVTRAAIEGGLYEETAFTLSDLYIRRMELCKTTGELSQLNEQMGLDFTQQVNRIKTSFQEEVSRPVQQCVNYIEEHFQEKITLEDLALQVHLSSNYLSQLFKKEMKRSIHTYIVRRRIEEAKRLLHYTDYSYSEISALLAFHSQSHFIQVFKKYTEMTPKIYRNKKRNDLKK